MWRRPKEALEMGGADCRKLLLLPIFMSSNTGCRTGIFGIFVLPVIYLWSPTIRLSICLLIEATLKHRETHIKEQVPMCQLLATAKS